MNGWVYTDGFIDDGWMDVLMDLLIIDECMGGHIDEWMDGWVDILIDG